MDSGKFDKVISIIDQLKTRIKSMRQAGLESGGEYSIENLAFKVLRRSDFMNTLSDMRIKAYDSQMGINESLLLEGGAAGHMAHVFDDTDLTFADLKELIRRSLAGELDLESAVSEKCISGDSILILEQHGYQKISDVVDNKIQDNVLAFNIETQQNEFLPILKMFNNDVHDDWIEIELEDGKKILVTPNHRIYTENKGYIKAEELSMHDILKVI